MCSGDSDSGRNGWYFGIAYDKGRRDHFMGNPQKKIRERYGDDDIRSALEKLRHMKQKKGEAVQNFAIPSTLSAYRTAKNESTGFSPFYIIYGRDPVLPVDTLPSSKYRYQGKEYVPTMLENMRKAHHHVQYTLAMSHERNKFYYDGKAKPVQIRVGDMVYFRDPSDAAQSSKLTSHWKPFYRVIKALSEVTFVIKNQLSGYTKVVNAQNLRLANSETEWKNISDEPSHIDSKY